MKVKLLFLLFILSISAKSSDYEFNGYIYDMPTINGNSEGLNNLLEQFNMPTNNNLNISNLTRIRLRPEVEITDDSYFMLHYEMDFNYSNMENFIMPVDFKKTNRQAVDMNWKIYSQDDKISYINNYIDRLYYKHFFNWGEITIGRQNLSFGVGRVWQPTDKFNPISPTSFSKFEKDGADAISTKIYFGNFSDISFIYNYTGTWIGSNYATKIRTNTLGFDLSLMGGVFDNNYAIGSDFAGSILGAGIRGEAIYNFISNNRDSNYIKAIFGIDYQFNEKLYGLIEYQYNGQGVTCKCKYFENLLKIFSGEMQNIGVNYIAAQVNYQLHPLWNLACMNISNIDDLSGLALLSITYSALDNLSIGISGAYFYSDDKDDEYSYYPSAGYFLAQYYF